MKALQFRVSIPRFIALTTLGAANKKFYFNSPFSSIKLVDVPEPKLPSPEWVKIKTTLCGFCGSDLNLIFLKDSPTATPFTSYPCTLGHELCGEIVEVGNNVKDIQPRDRVTVAPHLGCATRNISPECKVCAMGRPGNCEHFAEGSLSPGMFIGICSNIGGGFAPFLVAHRSQIFKLPKTVSSESGALIEPLAVAIQAVLDNKPENNDKILIVGGGVIGSLIVRAIRAFDIACNITVIEPSPFAASLAKESGADHLISDKDVIAQASKLSGATSYKPLMGKNILMGGFTKIFDTVGHSATLNASMRMLATCGTLSIVGIGDNIKLDPTPLWLKLQTIKGVFAYGYNMFEGKRQHAFEIAINLVDKGKITIDDMLTHKFSIEKYKEMIDVNLHKGKYKAIKTAISFDA